jgi:hypothetical protein
VEKGCNEGGADDGCERVVVDDVVGQKKALLLFFSLGHMGLGRLVSLLLATLLGPVAFLVAVGAQIIVVHLALSFSSRLVAPVFPLPPFPPP